MNMLDRFEGDWRLRRVIQDRMGPDAEMHGTARFEFVDGALVQEETGLLKLKGQGQFEARRRYVWRQDADGMIAVDFEDGRFFHRFDPASDQAHATHDCPPDFYKVSYDFSDWPSWRSVWTVSGPRKDYTMQTDFQR